MVNRPGLQLKASEKLLITTEKKKDFKTIFELIKEGNVRRIKSNLEIEHLYNEKDIV